MALVWGGSKQGEKVQRQQQGMSFQDLFAAITKRLGAKSTRNVSKLEAENMKEP